MGHEVMSPTGLYNTVLRVLCMYTWPVFTHYFIALAALENLSYLLPLIFLSVSMGSEKLVRSKSNPSITLWDNAFQNEILDPCSRKAFGMLVKMQILQRLDRPEGAGEWGWRLSLARLMILTHYTEIFGNNC